MAVFQTHGKLVTGKASMKKCSIFMPIEDTAIQVDLRIFKPDCWGTALNYFTGPVGHNTELRHLAIKQGLKVSEYGIFDRKTGERLVLKNARGREYPAGKFETDLYDILGIHYVKPEDRINTPTIPLY